MKASGSIIIVTHNSSDTIRKCLNLLKQSTVKKSVLTIVVDNCSQDNTVELIEREYHWVRLIKSSNNDGFAAANNRGMEESEGEWIFFLNPDASVDMNSILLLADHLRSENSIGMVAPCIVDVDQQKTISYFPFLDLSTSTWSAIGMQKLIPINKLNGKWIISRKPSNTIVEVERVIGAAMMVRSKVIEEVGGFDNRYFLFSEEEDLCYRMYNAGWKIIYFPSVEVCHIGGTAMEKAKPISIASANWSRYIFLKKYRSSLAAELSRMVWIITLIVRLISVIILQNKSDKANVLKGYSDSIKSLISPGYFDKCLRPKHTDKFESINTK